MKRIFALIMVMMVFIGMVPVNADFESFYDAPKVIFENLSDIPVVNAGGKFKYTFVIKNVGDEMARNVLISTQDTDAPILWETAINTYSLYRLSVGFKKEIELSFNVSETANNGVYEVPFKIEFTDTESNSFSTLQSVYFRVENELAKPLLIIENVETTPETVVAGGTNKLSFDLTNMGELKARRVKLTLTGLDKDGFMIADSVDNRYFETINGNDSKNISFDLLVSEKIKEGTTALSVKLEYFDQDDKSYSDEKTIYINDIQGEAEKDDEDNKKSTPKIIISSYSANPNPVTAGKKVNFAFTFKNTNETKTIKNMKIVVSSDDGVFNLEEGSNSFYVAELAPQEEMTKTIALRPKQDTLSRAYPVSIHFDYEDNDGNAYNAEEKINIQVVEYSNLTINNVYGPYEIYQGATGNLSFEYYNMGKAVISNLTASVEGDFTAKNEFNYIGNLEAGKSGYFDIDVLPVEGVSDECNGVLVLSFEDSSGEVHKVRKNFTGFVYGEMPSYNDMDMGMMDIPVIEEEETSLTWWQIALIVCGALFVVGFIIGFIVRKIRLKRMEEEI